MEVFKKNKILGKIIISFVAIAILLSPFAPIIKNTNQKLTLGIEKKEARAAFKDDFIATIEHSSLTSGSVDVNITLESKRDGAYWDYINANKNSNLGIGTRSGFQIALSKTENPFTIDGSNYNHPTWKRLGFDTEGVFNQTTTLGEIEDVAGFKINFKVTYGELTPETIYYSRFSMEDESGNDVPISNIETFKTLKIGEGEKPKDTTDLYNTGKLDFDCGITGFSVSGCVASFTVLIWQVSSWIAHLAGSFLDFFVYYSTNDNSYRNGFIEEGWGAVRDIANIFFIIALLYISIKIILGIAGHDSKKIIVMVILMALLINFSLFFSKVIIDSSNILAKVFYNNIEGKDPNGKTLTGDTGEKSISIGIIDKFNPQKLITQETYDMQGGHGKFIFTTLLSIAIVLYAAYVFFTIGILFVARVVSLWIYMIFAPIAFASYTVPFEIPGFGHKEWWKELLNNAFMAPIFVFFLYLIIKFTNFLKDSNLYPENGEFMAKLMAIVIPFIIIAVLLMKAKELVVKLSGEMGKAISGAAAVVGGLALGGAALGGAALGRKAVGQTAAWASRQDGSMKRAEEKIKFNKDLEAWKKNPNGRNKPEWEDHASNAGLKKNYNPIVALGAKVNEKQLKVNEIEHARHEIDETKKAAGLENVPDSKLTGADKKKIKTTFDKTKKAEVEAKIRKGETFKDEHGTDFVAKDENGHDIESESKFKSNNRKTVTDAYLNEIDSAGNHVAVTKGDAEVDTAGNHVLTKQGEKTINDKLQVAYDAKAKEGTTTTLDAEFKKLMHESNESIGMLTKGIAGINKGSFDIRNLSQLKSDKRDGFFSKVPTALIAGVAMGVRAGFKTTKIDPGVGQKDFLKDVGATIKDALKSAKIDVNLGGGGHGSAASGHGGGGHAKKDTHGGGGHH